MLYRQFQTLQLSALGMGCMRLPVTADNTIDEAATAEMVAMAMERGVNYYDTAWPYHGGNSEIVMGKILRRYPRDSYYLATKFPGFNLDNMARVEEIFEKQLEKTGMEYFDFYLFHNVTEANIDGYLDDEKYGILSYLLKQKKLGRIRHLGFSAHGQIPTMRRFLEAYGHEMEFCQIQLNWLDWSLQNARDKVKLLQEYNLPIWVMEPLRGGKLVQLEEQDVAGLKALRPGESVPGWSFRFLQSLESVTMILSGMSDAGQMADNLDTFRTCQPLNEEEKNALFAIARKMTGSVPCTACRYCTDYCPMTLEIPELLRLYNEYTYTNGGSSAKTGLSMVAEDRRPDSCIGCRSCEGVCPQNIKISEIMSDFCEKLNQAE